MGITAERLQRLKLVDEVVPEPLGGAHRDTQAMADALKRALVQSLTALQAVPIDSLLVQRRKRIASYGVFKEA
jgi:acetyl-CoA carboxylase carboxyl transferase subunit alpha